MAWWLLAALLSGRFGMALPLPPVSSPLKDACRERENIRVPESGWATWPLGSVPPSYWPFRCIQAPPSPGLQIFMEHWLTLIRVLTPGGLCLLISGSK